VTESQWKQIEQIIIGRYVEKGKDYVPEIAGAMRRALGNLPYDIAKAAAVKVCCISQKFAPDSQEILAAAAELYYPLPDEDAAWQDVLSRVGRISPPAALHPLIDTVLVTMGGLDALWHQMQHAETITPASILAAQFSKKWQRVSVAAMETVRTQLVLPEERRDLSLLPPPVHRNFALWAVVAPAQEQSKRLRSRQEGMRVQVGAAPAEVRRQIEAAGFGGALRRRDGRESIPAAVTNGLITRGHER
jgi:hypothetical protein